jgi:NodT family efflux transporter outer membrane factor (OMF) lipoprotein
LKPPDRKEIYTMYCRGNSDVRRFVTWLFLLTALACAVGPDFRPPEVQPPSGWVGKAPEMSFTPEHQAELVSWWTTFDDETLISLVDRAIASNLDLQGAAARIRQARASRGVVAAGLAPAADASASFTRRRSVGSALDDTSATTSNLFLAGLDAAWEMDIFGGVRREIEAADADIQFTIEDYRNTLVTLAAEVALNYLELRGFQQEVLIAQKNLAAQQHSAEITRKRFSAGIVSALDVANATAQVATTASQIPVFETSAQQAIYNLSVLLALEPSALVDELSTAAPIPGNPPAIPLLLPSDLLLRRPDIRGAEAQIQGATARIGVATADLFPKFNLVGSAGFEGDESGEWLKRAYHMWSFGPSVSWNVFDAGRIRSNIALQKGLQEETVLAYEKTVLTAFQEVENALIAYAKEQERRTALIEAVTANRKAVDLSTRLYTEGLTDFLNVLIAQRLLFDSEDALVQSTRNISTDLVALYKALGGGWENK